jgi:hypothetical protein
MRWWLLAAESMRWPWVSVQGYSTEPWADLVYLWLLLNRHLLHIIRNIPEGARSHECAVGGTPAKALPVLIAGYLEHLDHHLDRLLAASR